MQFNNYEELEKYLVFEKTDLIVNITSFNSENLLEIFNKEQITKLIEIFSYKIFANMDEDYFLRAQKFGRRYKLNNFWEFFKKEDAINSDQSFGLSDRYGTYNLESEELIMGKTLKEITQSISIELDNKLIHLKILAKKVKNFRETGYMESNEERSFREARESSIQHLSDEMNEMYENLEQTGIFETNEERYQREVIDDLLELPNNSEKPFVKFDKLFLQKEKFKQKQLFEEE